MQKIFIGKNIFIEVCLELILQYFYVDKYSGTNYDYPDGFQTNGRMIVFASSFISLMIAIGGMANLGLLLKLGPPHFPPPPPLQFNTSVPHKRDTSFQPPKSLSTTPKIPQFSTSLSSTPITPRFNTKNPSVQHTPQTKIALYKRYGT